MDEYDLVYVRNLERRDSMQAERIAELEQQLATAQAELAALREPVAGLRLTREEAGRILRALRNEGIAVSEIEPVLEDLLDGHRIIAQQREQLASRDAWVRTADRLLREIVEAWGVIGTHDGYDTREYVRFLDAIKAASELPAPPADDEGGDDE